MERTKHLLWKKKKNEREGEEGGEKKEKQDYSCNISTREKNI